MQISLRAFQRVFTCKNRCRYSRERASQSLPKNSQQSDKKLEQTQACGLEPPGPGGSRLRLLDGAADRSDRNRLELLGGVAEAYVIYIF